MPRADRLRLVVSRVAPPADATDADLLARFAAGRDEAAFAELVARHGPMVFAVCRRVLGCAHDAEDAFQAAFLVLARRAGALRVRGSVGDWLHGAARRTALAARRAAARRRAREARLVPPEPAPSDDIAELRSVLDEELARLPEKYRAVLVLADLQQKDRRRVAAELGVPEGTVASRQARARELLAGRLSRRGWGLPAYLMAVSPAVVPAALASAAVARSAGTSINPASGAEALAREVVSTMTRKKLFVAAVVAAVAVGGGLAGLAAAGPDGPAAPQAPNRYAVSAAGNSTLLLDSATGDTWVLAPGKEPSWVPVRRPLAPPEPARPKPEESRPAAKPPEAASVALAIAGRLVPARSAQVAAPAAGVVSQVLVREGDEVKAGAPLVELDDTEAKLAIDAARAEINRAKGHFSDIASAARAGTAPIVDRRKAEADMMQAEVALRRAEVRLKATRVNAPFAGTVVKVGTAPGEAVRPDGPPVAVVATLRDLEAAFDVPESDAARVSVGQACVIRVAAGGAEYAGEVARIGAVVDPATATVHVRAKLTLTGGGPAPRPGSYVVVRLTGKK